MGSESRLGVDLAALQFVRSVRTVWTAVALPPVRDTLLVVASEHPLIAFGSCLEGTDYKLFIYILIILPSGSIVCN